MKTYTFDITHNKTFIEKDIENNILDKNIFKRLQESKLSIDEHMSKWEKYKRYINDYEYIYTNSDIHRNICNVSPISRSYFKLHEILQDFDILNNINNINICCIAEGPGGFIQSILNNTKNKDINIKNLYGITLISDDKEVPTWNPRIKNNKDITLLYGQDNTGDICNKDNIIDIVKNIGENTCDIITCDGGIDYSEDYNNQELSSYEFIYKEILLSLLLQKEGGTLIIKMFDLLYYSSIQLLYLLYQCYSNIYISKPHTSRITNSEKYIVCKGYKKNKNIINFLKTNFDNRNKFINIPKSFMDDIKFFNHVYIDNQIYNINKIIYYIKSNKILLNKPSNHQIEKAIEWCRTYNLELNLKCSYLKAF